MDNCKTCKWWGGQPYYLDCREGLKISARDVAQDLPRKTCGSPNIVDASDDGNKKMLPLNAAAYSDFESYKASFYTGPDFGCIHHEGLK